MMSDSRSDDTSDSGGEDKEVASRRAQLKIFAKTHTSKAHHKAIKTSLKKDQVHELADNLYDRMNMLLEISLRLKHNYRRKFVEQSLGGL